jgi:hypothetical protein
MAVFRCTPKASGVGQAGSGFSPVEVPDLGATSECFIPADSEAVAFHRCADLCSKADRQGVELFSSCSDRIPAKVEGRVRVCHGHCRGRPGPENVSASPSRVSGFTCG